MPLSIPYTPADAAVAINDMLDCCAVVKPGQNVLILAAIDGLHGGRNLVDEQTIAWIQSGVQARGADPTVLWADMPSRPNVIWPDIPTPETAWKIPPIVKAAMKGADLVRPDAVDSLAIADRFQAAVLLLLRVGVLGENIEWRVAVTAVGRIRFIGRIPVC